MHSLLNQFILPDLLFQYFQCLIQLIISLRIFFVLLVLDLHIRGDTFAVDIPPLRGEILRDRKLHTGSVLQVEYLLYDALAIGLCPHDRTNPVVLNRSRIDLRCTGAVAVHQDCQRQFEPAPGVRFRLLPVAVLILCVDDQPFRKHKIQHLADRA